MVDDLWWFIQTKSMLDKVVSLKRLVCSLSTLILFLELLLSLLGPSIDLEMSEESVGMGRYSIILQIMRNNITG